MTKQVTAGWMDGQMYERMFILSILSPNDNIVKTRNTRLNNYLINYIIKT